MLCSNVLSPGLLDQITVAESLLSYRQVLQLHLLDRVPPSFTVTLYCRSEQCLIQVVGCWTDTDRLILWKLDRLLESGSSLETAPCPVSLRSRIGSPLPTIALQEAGVR